MVDVVCFIMEKGPAFIPMDKAKVGIAVSYVLCFIVCFVCLVVRVWVGGHKCK